MRVEFCSEFPWQTPDCLPDGSASPDAAPPLHALLVSSAPIHSGAGGGCMFRVFPVGRGFALLAAGALAAGLALAQTAQTSQTGQTAAGPRDAMKDTIVK